MFVCVCVCVCVHVSACVCTCVRALACVRVQAPGFGEGLQYTNATLAGAGSFQAAELEVFGIQFPGQ